MNDFAYMARAIQLAKLGNFTAHPNPRVGCVIGTKKPVSRTPKQLRSLLLATGPGGLRFTLRWNPAAIPGELLPVPML